MFCDVQIPSYAVFQKYLHICILRCEVVAVMEVQIIVVDFGSVVF